MLTFKVAAAAAIALCVPAAAFVAGSAVVKNDGKLFLADDKRHATMLARSCGKAGRLVQDPLSNTYLCLYVNPDGSTLTVEAQQHPYLDQLARR
jgi:hypothetical protein